MRRLAITNGASASTPMTLGSFKLSTRTISVHFGTAYSKDETTATPTQIITYNGRGVSRYLDFLAFSCLNIHATNSRHFLNLGKNQNG
jgi:hypothetical protein